MKRFIFNGIAVISAILIGLMKSELLYLQQWDSVEQFKKELIRYIHYYNNDRIKLRLNGKSPVQYRALFQSKNAS